MHLQSRHPFLCLRERNTSYYFESDKSTERQPAILYRLNSKPSGYYIYHQFKIYKLYVLPTQCVYVFCVDLRKKNANFPIQHELTALYNLDLTL